MKSRNLGPIVVYAASREKAWSRIIWISVGGSRNAPLKYATVYRRVSWTAKKTNEWVLNKAGVRGNC